MVNQHENTLWKGKPSHWYWFKNYLWLTVIGFLGLIFILPSFFDWLFVLPIDIESFIGNKQIVGVVLFLIVIAGVGYINLSRLANSRYTITNKRLSERHGLIADRTNEIRIQDVQAINLRISAWERLLAIGTLEVASSAGSQVEDIHLRGISNPKGVKELLFQLQNDHNISS